VRTSDPEGAAPGIPAPSEGAICMRDVAVVSFAQAPLEQPPGHTEALMLLPVITEALEQAGLDRRDVGFTCSGSADYLTGGAFTFVQMLEAAGAWPPIPESHVEMDGAWALYEAWVRIQHGDIDTALVYASGRADPDALREILCLQLDPYYLLPIWPDYRALAALQAQAVLAATGRTEADLAEIAVRARADAKANPYAVVSGDVTTDELLADDYVVAPLRPHDLPAVAHGAAAIVLAADDKARTLSDRPAWITGIDHRVDPQYPGVRDLATSPSARLAAEQAGVGKGPVEVAELAAISTAEELVLADALGLDADTVISPSGGALVANPVMVTGLVRIGEAFRQVNEHGHARVVAHASSGPCLQQNLVCVLEDK
jgi:acetyl-CoA acetyltransferase